MVIHLDDFMAKLPPSEREAIQKRTAELIAEEKTLRRTRARPRRSAAKHPKSNNHEGGGPSIP